MESLFRISLLVAGFINILPAMLTFFPSKISKSYGIAVVDTNLELLLRHRASMFLIVGGLLIYSSCTKQFYELAVIIGLFSMITFVVLYFQIKLINPSLRKVMLIDIFAALILLIGYALKYFQN